MLLLQYSTSHYCRKARLALGFKQIPFRVENLTPGLHLFRLKPLTGLTTVPVLLPQLADQPPVLGDSTEILRFLEAYRSHPSFTSDNPQQNAELWMLEDWLDESIGTATRFVYYDFRAGAGKQLDSSLASQAVIQTVRWQYGISSARVALAVQRLMVALDWLEDRWQKQAFLTGDRLTIVDITAAALLSPLARIPDYRQRYPWLFDHIIEIHQLCGEPLPPGLESIH